MTTIGLHGFCRAIGRPIGIRSEAGSVEFLYIAEIMCINRIVQEMVFLLSRTWNIGTQS